MMKKILLILAACVLLAGGAYLYLTRPTTPPSEDAVEGQAVKNTVEDEFSGQVEYAVATGTAEFRIQETLRGEPKLVIGKTDMVSGSIKLDVEDLARSGLGTVLVNARDLETDEEGRNNMLRRFILKTEDAANESIAFRPKQIANLSGPVAVGEKKVFTVLGDLTVAGTTRPVAFDVEATFTDENTLQVHAVGMVKYADFGITIPEIPFVANVADSVFIVIDFTAEKPA